MTVAFFVSSSFNLTMQAGLFYLANIADAMISWGSVAILSLTVSCALLSLVVVWRRWAFLGEGIAHAGFGGAGTAWLLACVFPMFDGPGYIMLAITLFCFATAIVIGIVHRDETVHSETAIGIFLVASLAWGFVGQQAYFAKYSRSPAGFQALLFGHTQLLGSGQAQLCLALALVCVVVLAAFRKEILAWCLEPTLAQVSGVRAGFIHYLMILLIAATVVLGVQLVGSVLMTALLILPGATAMLLTRRLLPAAVWTLAIGLAGAVIGLAAHSAYPLIWQGPAVVLSLVIIFLIVFVVRRVMGT